MYNEAIMLGILVSLLYTEFTGLSAGLIIPGYLALYLNSPLRLGYTLAVAAAAVGLCHILSRMVILYGRRRFAIQMLLTFFLAELVDLSGFLPGGVSVIGIVIPGIIAREFDRQGFRDTLLSMAVTTGFVVSLLFIMRYLAMGAGQ